MAVLRIKAVFKEMQDFFICHFFTGLAKRGVYAQYFFCFSSHDFLDEPTICLNIIYRFVSVFLFLFCVEKIKLLYDSMAFLN